MGIDCIKKENWRLKVNRFFINKEQINGDIIEIRDGDVKHIRDVLRLKPGDEIEIGCESRIHIGVIQDIHKRKIDVRIKDHYQGKNETSKNIILYQGIAKGNKMDFILQKCTEIGVSKFIPLETMRTVVKIKNDKKANSKIDRWQDITEQAAKQSKRDIVPRVEMPLNFSQMIEELKDKEHIIVPYEDERQESIKSALSSIGDGDIHLVIGPEGGFDAEEIESLKEIGAKIVSLGPRILRTETAALVASTMIFYELGDLGVV